jgi:transcriptional regulator with XRE-family HTH domain
MDTDMHLGQRVAHLRRRRGISQVTLAGRMGRSESWISKVERGERRIDRVSVIEQLAMVLDVDPGTLLGWGEGSHGEEPREVGAIRAALMRYDAIAAPAAVGVPDTVPTPGAPAVLPDLRREVERVWADFQASRHRAAASALPELLQRADVAARALDGDGRLEALGLLAFAYQATAATLLKAGATELAWVAADRGVSAAERSGNRLALAGCSRMVVHAFLDAGHCRRALELASEAAGALRPELDGSPGLESVYGALLLKGAVAAARGGDRTATRELLAEAGGAAERLGGDHNHCWTAFGPANVALHAVATAVELGDGGEAVTGALAIDPLRLPALERRAQRLIDLARGYGLWSRDAEAVAALLEAESLAPEEVRRQRAAHALVGELLRRQRRGAGGELHALAGRLTAPG